MTDARWVTLTEVAAGFEADLLREELEAEGIPVLLRGLKAGIYGGGFQGAIIGGVEVQVPSPELERAREILETRLRPDVD